MINNMHSHPLQELIHSEVCLSFRNDMKEKLNISFKIRNSLPVILPNQTYYATRGMAVILPSGEYVDSNAVK